MAKRPAKATERPTDSDALQGLYGTNALPAMVEIAPGRSVQLGEIVRTAHAQSGLSAEDWNGLPQTERDALLNKTLADLQADPDTASYPTVQTLAPPLLEKVTIASALAGTEELVAALKEAAAGAAEGTSEALQEFSQTMVGEQVLIVSAPAGPRRRAGLAFGPTPIELREEDLGEEPDETINALRADPFLKLDYRFESRPADDD